MGDALSSMTDPAFVAFVRVSQRRLLGYAWRLAGDRVTAEDLVQEALLRTAMAWPRITRREHPESYVQVVIARLYVDRWHRRRREATYADVPDTQAIGVDVDTRLDVRDALRGLTTKQRAVVVMRYYLDMTEAEIAVALGIANGTVKSTASDALARLRISLEDLQAGIR